MGKKHKKRSRSEEEPTGFGPTLLEMASAAALAGKQAQESPGQSPKAKNPLWKQQNKFLQGLSRLERQEFFSPELSSDRRAELWMEQAELGEGLVNQYAWATPNETALRILKEFSPLVEIGCGANAYWCQVLRGSGIDIVGYDVNIEAGGTIGASHRQGKSKKKRSYLKQGGPEVLSSKEIVSSNRTLFLCYPDEYDDEEESSTGSNGEEDEDDNERQLPTSMGWQCLDQYEGDHVIHVGELFLDANYSMEQAPWGRSSSPEFQQRLASEFHCLLKVELPNWLHTRDTISAWKRSTISTIVFAADEDDDEDDEEVEYRHIPSNERLPVNVAAPCLMHLLPASTPNETARRTSPNTESPQLHQEKQQKKKRKRNAYL